MDGLSQDFLDGAMQPEKLRAFEATSHPSRSNPRVKEALVRVYVANAVQQSLIEQSSLDCQPPPAKKLRKRFLRNRQGLAAWPGKRFVQPQIPEFQPAKSPWIDKSHLAATCQSQPRMSVRRYGAFRSGNQQSPCHSKMHNPLS